MEWIWIELIVAAVGFGWGLIKGGDIGGPLVAVGLAVAMAGLATLLFEGIWQGVAFLRSGSLPDHSLSAVFGPVGQTGWLGLDFLLTKAFEAPIAYGWGGLMGLGLFITWLAEEVFN